MSKIGDRQNAILATFSGRESFTKSEAVDLLGSGYYCNASKYVGEILSRMVKRRLIRRVKRGVYRVGRGLNPPAPPSSPPEGNDGKCKWCAGRGCLACN